MTIYNMYKQRRGFSDKKRGWVVKVFKRTRASRNYKCSECGQIILRGANCWTDSGSFDRLHMVCGRGVSNV